MKLTKLVDRWKSFFDFKIASFFLFSFVNDSTLSSSILIFYIKHNRKDHIMAGNLHIYILALNQLPLTLTTSSPSFVFPLFFQKNFQI